jgi:hypothetical protein
VWHRCSKITFKQEGVEKPERRRMRAFATLLLRAERPGGKR